MSESILIQLAKTGKLAYLLESYHDLFPREFWSDYLDVFKIIVDQPLQISTTLLKDTEVLPSSLNVLSIITQNRCSSRINKLVCALRGGGVSFFDYEKIKDDFYIIKKQIEDDLSFDLKNKLPFFKDKDTQDFLKKIEEISFVEYSPFIIFCKTKNGKTLGIRDTRENYFYIKELTTEEDKTTFINIKNDKMENEYLLNFYEFVNPSMSLFFVLREYISNQENNLLQFPEKNMSAFYEKDDEFLPINERFESFLNIQSPEQIQKELMSIQVLFSSLLESMLPYIYIENKEKCERVEKYIFAAYYFIEMKKISETVISSSDVFKIETIEDIRKIQTIIPLLTIEMKKGIIEKALHLLECPVPVKKISKKKEQKTMKKNENKEEHISVEFPRIEGISPLHENYMPVKKNKETTRKENRGSMLP